MQLEDLVVTLVGTTEEKKRSFEDCLKNPGTSRLNKSPVRISLTGLDGPPPVRNYFKDPLSAEEELIRATSYHVDLSGREFDSDNNENPQHAHYGRD